MKRYVAILTAVAVLTFFTGIKYVEAALPANASFPSSANIQGRWQLDEASGTRADVSGNGNTLADNNTVGSTTGINEAGASSALAADFFVGNTEFLSIGDGSQTGLDAQDHTVSMWVNIRNAPGLFALYGKAGSGDEAYRCFYRSTTKIQCDMFDASSNETQWEKTQDLGTGTWQHLIIAVDVSEAVIKMYLNGASISPTQTDSAATSIRNSGGDFQIGAQASATTHNGQIQDLVFLNTFYSAANALTTYELYTVAQAAGGGAPTGAIWFSFIEFHAKADYA